MPRANRHFLPGHIRHITHRCHPKAPNWRSSGSMVRLAAMSGSNFRARPEIVEGWLSSSRCRLQPFKRSRAGKREREPFLLDFYTS
jgi:hypothetical protein